VAAGGDHVVAAVAVDVRDVERRHVEVEFEFGLAERRPGRGGTR
jgi:hypothetical protein